MKRANLLFTLTALLVGFFSSGCLVVDGSSNGYYETQCHDECEDYEVCESYCDSFECWDECWIETSCDAVCEEVYVETETVETTETTTETETENTVECYSNVDCGKGKICLSNVCKAKNTTEHGSAGLCQACETNQDCLESGALCVKLNFNKATKVGEKVCSRPCESSAECPTAFECISVSQEAGVSSQCLPVPNASNKRTCSASSELECIRASDCVVGESCVNNKCVAPASAECDAKKACSAGQVCRDFKCVADSSPECVDRKDCKTGELCLDGSCEKAAISCVFNSECDAGACVNGECLSVCNSSTECGNNERCRQGLCEALECQRTSDCGANEMCVDAQCETRCANNANCGAGFICNANKYCEADPSVACRSNAECARDEICNAGTCAAPCNCNQQCATGQVCGDSGLCLDTATPPTQCQTDCDCTSGQSCSAGRCK